MSVTIILFKNNWPIIYILFRNGAHIGFCDQDFPLEDTGLGREINSIGIEHKGIIWIDDYHIHFKGGFGRFDVGDFVGIGIITQSNSRMQYFATLNGELFGIIIEKYL